MRVASGLRHRCLVFRRGDATLALEGQYTRQVVALEALTPVPRSDPALLGLMHVRGDIVPLLDPQTLLEGERQEGRLNPVSLGLIVQDGNERFALAAEAVVGFVALRGRVPLSDKQPQGWQRYGLAQVAYGEASVLILDTPRLLASLRQRLVVV